MLKKIALVAVLVAAGVGIAMYLHSGATPARPEQVFTPRAGASDAERIADLERTLAAQVDRATCSKAALRSWKPARATAAVPKTPRPAPSA